MFINLFHLYGFNECHLSGSCIHLHQNSDSIKGWHYNRKIIVLTLSILPVLGQLIGFLEIAVGVRALFSIDKIERINGASLLIRGIVTCLGLGIICLLIDLIVTLCAHIKNCCIRPLNKNGNP